MMGKHKPTYLPHCDKCGDWVVVTNAAGAKLTGEKMQKKLYRWHTQYPGGLRELTARQMAERAPERLISIAVKGMLPNNEMREWRMRRLRIFRGAEHTHERQTAESAAYAPKHMATVYPEKYEPREKAVTGSLVVDYFPGADQDELKELRKSLVPQSKDESLGELHEELARLAAAEEAEKSRKKAGFAGLAAAKSGAAAGAATAAAAAAPAAASAAKLR